MIQQEPTWLLVEERLDLDGDGIEAVGINVANPILFDHEGTGLVELCRRGPQMTRRVGRDAALGAGGFLQGLHVTGAGLGAGLAGLMSKKYPC